MPHGAATLCFRIFTSYKTSKAPFPSRISPNAFLALQELHSAARISSRRGLSHALPLRASRSSTVVSLPTLGGLCLKPLLPCSSLRSVPHPPPSDSPQGTGAVHLPPQRPFSPAGGQAGDRWSESLLWHLASCVSLAQLLSTPTCSTSARRDGSGTTLPET